MHVLVVGGAGYIGSHMVKMLDQRGCQVTVLDDLSAGYRDAVVGGRFVLGDLGDEAVLDALFKADRFDGVMHFASYIQVGESVREPAKYYRNNTFKTQVLLDAMRSHQVKHFIFSSTAAIFGEPVRTPIDEEHPKNPINPYGRGKWMVEQMLEDYALAYGLKAVKLRYFNAAGADPAGQLGERHDPETHLIPLVLQAAGGRRPNITVFGDDYDTPDGTCIRDYIHVTDLCEAHWLALRRLWEGGASAAYNLGNGNGFSVREVIDTARTVSGRDFTVVYGERRPGDPARLVADSQRARTELGWEPRYAELATIVEHAWRWETRQR
ncbi:MAG: UDP-glucose 4-epimerase GalE [Candidatus Competibacteraceae bacterium]|nr:UDP-glucose 4-epimerase GalE [Candidatus Competibacteraceae bacterium]MBK8897887.1 UDP-glucose 4-epimerase GalE [Candidatus Competibacteraceae bacterium]MBK8961689.1 UDP-glucose 4-epimerase GalE [Candidatus Competibacteraceae bacterium]